MGKHEGWEANQHFFHTQTSTSKEKFLLLNLHGRVLSNKQASF
jgi:hypothetical protein